MAVRRFSLENGLKRQAKSIHRIRSLWRYTAHRPHRNHNSYNHYSNHHNHNNTPASARQSEPIPNPETPASGTHTSEAHASATYTSEAHVLAACTSEAHGSVVINQGHMPRKHPPSICPHEIAYGKQPLATGRAPCQRHDPGKEGRNAPDGSAGKTYLGGRERRSKNGDG